MGWVTSGAIPNRWDMMTFGSQAIGTADNTDATRSHIDQSGVAHMDIPEPVA